MTSKPLRFHPQAEQEYLTALAWYRKRSPIAAINFESTFEQAVARIRKAPQRWPVYVADFRKYTLRQFPFSIVYQDFSSEIVIFAVAHGRREPGYWSDRE
jgi:plasmid stabilization system protein ParE